MREPRILVIAPREALSSWKGVLDEDMVELATIGSVHYGARFDLIMLDVSTATRAQPEFGRWLHDTILCRLSPTGKLVYIT